MRNGAQTGSPEMMVVMRASASAEDVAHIVGLIEEAGHDRESGAILFATTSYFLERMGMKTLDDLPPLAPQLPEVDELEAELGQLAEAAANSARADPEPEKRAPDPVPEPPR